MLILCCTPLQLMIAKSIIKTEKISHFKLLYFTVVDGEKHRRYYEKLADFSVASEYVHLNSRFPFHFPRYARALSRLNAGEEMEIACASIDNFYVQHAIRKYKYKKIFTFDDGTANISPQSAYYIARRSHLYNFARKLLRGSINEQWIRRQAVLHYTIYPGLSNLVEQKRLRTINLLDVEEWKDSERKVGDKLSIFLGQPIAEINDKKISKNYSDIVNGINVDEYLPHPRERMSVEGRRVINTPLIAEDYILSKVAEYNEVSVYSLSSTALMNIEHPRLKKIIVKYPSSPEVIVKLYPLFENRGCVFLEAEEILGKKW